MTDKQYMLACATQLKDDFISLDDACSIFSTCWKEIAADKNLTQTDITNKREELLAEHIESCKPRFERIEKNVKLIHDSASKILTAGRYDDERLIAIKGAFDMYGDDMPLEVRSQIADDAQARYIYAKAALKEFQQRKMYDHAELVRSCVEKYEALRDFNYNAIADCAYLATYQPHGRDLYPVFNMIDNLKDLIEAVND